MIRKIRSFCNFLRLSESSGLAQIPIILGLLLMAIAVPVATKLVQENQNTQNRAAGICCRSPSGGSCVSMTAASCPSGFTSCTCPTTATSTPRPAATSTQRPVATSTQRPAATSTPRPGCSVTGGACANGCCVGYYCQGTANICLPNPTITPTRTATIAPTNTLRPTATNTPALSACEKLPDHMCTYSGGGCPSGYTDTTESCNNTALKCCRRDTTVYTCPNSNYNCHTGSSCAGLGYVSVAGTCPGASFCCGAAFTPTPSPAMCGGKPVGTKECYRVIEPPEVGYNQCMSNGLWKATPCTGSLVCANGGCVTPTPVTTSCNQYSSANMCIGKSIGDSCTVSGQIGRCEVYAGTPVDCHCTVLPTPMPVTCGGKAVGTRECYAGGGGYNECLSSGVWGSTDCYGALKCANGYCVTPTSTPVVCGASGQKCCFTEYVGSIPIYNTCNSGLYCYNAVCGTSRPPTITSAPANCTWGGVTYKYGDRICGSVGGFISDGCGPNVSCGCDDGYWDLNRVDCGASSRVCVNGACVAPTSTPTPNHCDDMYSDSGCKGVAFGGVCTRWGPFGSGIYCIKQSGSNICSCVEMTPTPTSVTCVKNGQQATSASACCSKTSVPVTGESRVRCCVAVGANAPNAGECCSGNASFLGGIFTCIPAVSTPTATRTPTPSCSRNTVEVFPCGEKSCCSGFTREIVPNSGNTMCRCRDNSVTPTPVRTCDGEVVGTTRCRPGVTNIVQICQSSGVWGSDTNCNTGWVCPAGGERCLPPGTTPTRTPTPVLGNACTIAGGRCINAGEVSSCLAVAGNIVDSNRACETASRYCCIRATTSTPTPVQKCWCQNNCTMGNACVKSATIGGSLNWTECTMSYCGGTGANTPTPTLVPGQTCVAGAVNTFGCGGQISESVARSYHCSNPTNLGAQCASDRVATMYRTASCVCSITCSSNTCVGGGPTNTPGQGVPTNTPRPQAATNTPGPGGCQGNPPADVCAASLLQVRAACVNNQWDFDDQLCNLASRVDVCGGRDYCCPAAGGSWTTDMSRCGGITATPTPGQTACRVCPSNFGCYQNGNEFKWFVSGYVMQGFTAVAEGGCTDAGVVKPVYLGKSRGDANCDGSVDVADYTLWQTEFRAGDYGAVQKSSWETDFTGPMGSCDGLINISDYTLWQTNFNRLNGNN